MLKNSRGSISIETAISFSLVLVFIASIINVFNVYKTDILMQRSVRYISEEFSLYSPLSIIPGDMVSTINSVLPEEQSEQFNGGLTTLNNSFNSLFDAEDFTSQILDASLSHKFESTILAKYIEFNKGSSFYAPEDIYVDFRYDRNQKIIFVYVNYSLMTITGRIDREITDAIPFWGDYLTFESDDDSDSSDSDSFWSLGNFERGQWLRDNFDANLPATFPVINGYRNGEIYGVTSIDLNSSWNSNESNLRSRLNGEIEDLANFHGADVAINGNRYQISESQINSRTLYIVIPENSPEESRNIVYSYADDAISRGINVVVVEMDES